MSSSFDAVGICKVPALVGDKMVLLVVDTALVCSLINESFCKSLKKIH